MIPKRELGQQAETLAADFIRNEGYKILHENWRYKAAEIDLIAMEGSILVFVEVRMRSSTEYGRPEQTLNKRKRRLIIDAAMAYIHENRFEGEIRFDVASVILGSGKKPFIRLFRDAFFPGLNWRS